MGSTVSHGLCHYETGFNSLVKIWTEVKVQVSAGHPRVWQTVGILAEKGAGGQGWGAEWGGVRCGTGERLRGKG